MTGPEVCGEPAIDRLMRQLDYRLSPGTERLTADQVAVVLHALADHTAIVKMLVHRPPEPPHPWPVATSVGRWFHDVADQAVAKRERSRPVVRFDPGISWGGASVRGISVEHVVSVQWSDGLRAACDEYGLRREDVLISCWFAGRHGHMDNGYGYGAEGRRMRQRYGAWAREHETAYGRWDEVPDPPEKED